MSPIASVAPDLIARVRALPTGVICDAMGRLDLSGYLDGVQPLNPAAKMAGRVRTLRFAAKRNASAPPTNPYAAIRSCDPGDILVFGTDGAPSWMFGENIATAAQRAGLAGIVTDANARDGGALTVHPFPVFARGLAVRPPTTIEIVDVDVPISFAGAQIVPGDVLAGDADGIVVIPGSHVADVVLQGEDLAILEGLQMQAIVDGVPLPQLLDILKKKKIKK